MFVPPVCWNARGRSVADIFGWGRERAGAAQGIGAVAAGVIGQVKGAGRERVAPAGLGEGARARLSDVLGGRQQGAAAQGVRAAGARVIAEVQAAQRRVRSARLGEGARAGVAHRLPLHVQRAAAEIVSPRAP